MFFCGGSQSCFILWPREKDVVLFYEWPQGFLNVLETQRVCPVKQRSLMLFLFVWFLLFKFPPGRRGKQSLTVKQIGKHFFFLFHFLNPSCLSEQNWCTETMPGLHTQPSKDLLFVPLCHYFLNCRSKWAISLCQTVSHITRIKMSRR